MIMRLKDEDFYNPTLILTDKDKVKVGELRKWKNCPVLKCLKNLEDDKEVFFKKKGKFWAFSLEKDYLN